jgi:hypothetical protein
MNRSEREKRLESALVRIEKWFGEFPATNQFWDETKERPMSYASCYGSNGEREFMRDIARKALEK